MARPDRPEPFRAMIEQALRSDVADVRPTRAPAFDRRLDQVALAGVTPPRGLKPPAGLRLERPALASPPPLVNAPSDALVHELEAKTKKIDRPLAVDAMILDAIAAAEATREMPPQSLPQPRQDVDVRPPPRLVSMPELAKPAAPEPVSLARPMALLGESRTPPPLPKAKPRPVTVSTAPVPKLMTVLDEVTIPGMTVPSSSSSGTSSSSGKIKSSDLYRLQLEFEDTPARPLPALASLLPMPVLPDSLNDFREDGALADALDGIDFCEANESPALVDPMALGGVESTDLRRLDELDGIQDLDVLAQALGLKSVVDVSIPSDEGLPVLDDDFAPPRTFSAVRRAAVMAALGEDEGRALPVERPKLQAQSAAVPVIVRIPSRPKVSLEAREQARSLYLAALDALGKKDRIGAVGHLKLAIHYDDGVQLYRDLLAQLERSTKSGEAVATSEDTEAPALMVMKPSGRMTSPRAEWQTERRR